MGHGAKSEQGPDGLGSGLIALIERLVLYAALALSVAAVFLWRTPQGVGSVAAGGLLVFLNLYILRRTIVGILG